MKKHILYYRDMTTKYIQFKIRGFLYKYVIVYNTHNNCNILVKNQKKPAIFWYAPFLNRNYMSHWLQFLYNQVFSKLLSQTHLRYKDINVALLYTIHNQYTLLHNYLDLILVLTIFGILYKHTIDIYIYIYIYTQYFNVAHILHK